MRWGLEGAAAEEEEALVGVGQGTVAAVEHALAFDEVFLVVDEVDLHACRGDGAYLDDELVVAIVDDEVHAGKADDLMELMFAVVHLAEFRHEDPDFASNFLRSGRQIATENSLFALG